MTDVSFAQLSDWSVAAAIALYAMAMLTFAVASARRVTASRSLAEVASSATTSSTGSTGPAVIVADRGRGTEDQPLGLLDRVAFNLTVVAVLLHAAALVARGLAAGRAPWGNMYEYTLGVTLVAGVALVVSVRSQPVARDLGGWLTGLLVLALGLAVTVLFTPADELIPVLDSYWLVIHVAAAITGGGIFTIGALATVGALVRRRAGSSSAERLERLAYGAHLVAFPIWTFAVIAGAIWAENAWGRYWGWDPKETWAFITWVFYAAYLHAQATPRWRQGRASALALAGYTAFLFNLFGVNMWITGLHSYAGV